MPKNYKMMEKVIQLDDKLHWYKDAIIYELHIKAFRDGDGDGIGDFKGLLEKLDYLKDLGVTAIWLLPFYPSPLRDDGYDIADYYAINPSYGDIEQFKQLLLEAHQRNLKVITELVINHTSDQHPWFQRARKAPKGSVERDYYVWTDDPTQYKDVRIIFQDFETSNWTWDSVAEQYYWHRFFHHQPDLNYDSDAVQLEVFKIIDFWCEMGVDGFRLDAVPYLYERENTNGENLPETHAYLKKLRAHVDKNFPGTVLLAEANMWPEDSASYFGDGDECQMNYHFPVMPRMFMALQMEDRYPITDIFDQTPAIPSNCQWAIFLRNHDELTLEMVTDEERDYMYKVYAKNPKAKINLGIRHRLAPLMDNNRRRIELMNVLLFSLKGTPVIYYGDEIGMGDNFYLGDRDGVRTPMQWSPDRNAGFSNANPQQLYLPLILDPEYQFEAVNVETQRRNPSSLLWFMKHLINMRKNFKAFGRGDMVFINSENAKVLAFVRSYEEEKILVIVNLSKYTQSAELELAEFKYHIPVEVFGRNRFPVIKENTNYFFTLGPHDHHWLQLEKAYQESVTSKELPSIAIASTDDFLKETSLRQLEKSILPAYLQKAEWFNVGKRLFREILITEAMNIPSANYRVALLLIEVSYEDGLPETYQLPIVVLKDQQADNYLDNHLNGVICRFNEKEENALLCDAFYTNTFRQNVLMKMAANDVINLGNNSIWFSGKAELRTFLDEQQQILSKVLAVDEQNTCIAYDNKYFLKMYRRVDRTIHPEMEMTKFLTEEVHFQSVPDLVGGIKLQSGKDTIVLGMLQPHLPFHGNGKTFMIQRLDNFYDRITARKSHPARELKGTLTNPLDYDSFPEDLKEFIGGTVAEGIQLIGRRTGEMHLALASPNNNKDFTPESFSLHYQRSLFAGFQSLVRTAFDDQEELLQNVAAELQPALSQLLQKKEQVLQCLKRIYAKKIDVVKIRIHGNYHLNQVVFTGKDVAIVDFLGDRMRSYSERRLKRSPLRDVASMLLSVHYVAHEELLVKRTATPGDRELLASFAELWVHYVTGLFMRSYLDTVNGAAFIPSNERELAIMVETFLLEKALQAFEKESAGKPNNIQVPMHIINSLLGNQM